MKKLLFAFMAFVLAAVPALAGFDGSTPEAGVNYYLYNLYQSKFLSESSTLGGTPMTVTPTSATEVTINSQAYTITTADEGYNLTYDANGTTMALMFSAGSACANDTLSSGFNADKGLWLFVSESEYKEYTEKKRFKFAALNVDGMPKTISIGLISITLNSDAKEEAGATAIGTKVAGMGYDVVGLSEDFNYHDELMTALQAANSNYKSMTHRGKISLSAISGITPLFDTDGLGLLYNTTTNTASEESWTSWEETNGYTDDGSDELIDKGFRYYLITLTDGTEIDLYILHMDAETTDEDLAARESQLTQLADTILASSNKRPIIVMGDTNCRYTRDNVKTLFIDVLNNDSRFTVTDPWITYGRQGLYPTYGTSSLMASSLGYRQGEVVDKLFMINNTESDIRLVAESYAQDLSFVDDDGEALADHWPCVVEFSYHDYDPLVDDVVDDSSMAGKTYYLRNVATGYYLKAGGWWGTHALQGEYGQPITFGELSDGVYALQSPMGYVGGTDPYMDATSYTSWTLLQGSKGYILTTSGVALAAEATTSFSAYGPNTGYVTTATLNTSDTYQQWELLTSDDILEEAQYATMESPANLTHLLPGANFDRNDSQVSSSWQGWPTTATKMTHNYADGQSGSEQGNYVAEVYVESYSGWTTYGTTWNIYQKLSVPNGHFKVTGQSFQRIADKLNNANVNLSFYANNDSTQVLDISAASCTDNIGSTTSGDYYYPNSMAEAALFFNAGYYQNSVETTVTDASLTVGLRKTWATKSSNVWTCFDNFQLLYYPLPSLTLKTVTDTEDDNYGIYYRTFSNKVGYLMPVTNTTDNTTANPVPYRLTKIAQGDGDGQLTLTFTALSANSDSYYEIPAETGILFRYASGSTSGDLDESITFDGQLIPTDNASSISGTNYLTPQLTAETVTEDNWGQKLALYNYSTSTKLGTNNGTDVNGLGLGFYTLRIGATMSANTAVILASDVTTALSESTGTDNNVIAATMIFQDSDDNVDAVETISLKADTNATDAIYDLSGRRVSRPVKGIYIVNGKKVLY